MSSPSTRSQQSFTASSRSASLFLRPSAAVFAIEASLSLLLLMLIALAGCGTGGYFGSTLSLSAAAVTIDAGQSYPVSAKFPGSSAVAWSVSCGSSACGSISATSGPAVTYTAPAGLSAQLKVTLTASVPGTGSSAVVVFTDDPDPVITGTPPAGTVGVPYTTTLTAAGGTAPLVWSLASGALPAGLTFNPATGVIAGTPTATGSFLFVVQAIDSSAVPFTVTASETIVITAPAALTLSGNPPAGTVGTAYASSLVATGGVAPYSFSLVSGALPTGLSLSSTGAITGTPTASGTFTFTAQAQDSTGTKTTGVFSITIAAAPATLTLTSSMLPSGTVGVPYSATIGVSGGTAPYRCVFTAGTLPAGLSLTGCTVSGTPTAAGTANLTVQATDSSNPAATGSGPESITIVAAPLAIASPPSGTVGVVYTGTIPVSGGQAPYSCKITSGTLPSGLSLTGCVITGTPTAAGTTLLTVQATDSNSPATVTSGPITIVINPAPLAIATGSLPAGTVGVAYSSTIGVSGGTSPYTCTILSGTLQAGLTLGPNCLVSGTPTIAGTVSLNVKATDSGNPTLTATGVVGLTINPAPTVISIGNPPAATVGTPYMGPIPIGGGTGPYTCSLLGGTLPTGLSLNNCVITGTPVGGGTVTVTVGVIDSGKPPVNTSGPVTITVNPATPILTLGNPPVATVGTPYTGVIPVAGGTAPFTCTLVSGTLPAGLTLSNCTLTGTPTTPVTATLTITATDSSNPAGTTTGAVVVTVQPLPALTFTGSLPNAVVNVAYTQTLHASGGVAPYTYALTAGALPAGVTLSGSGVISGTPTAVGAYSFTATAIDSEGTPQTASLPLVLLVTYATTANDAELQGPYAFLFQGYDDVAAGLFAYQTATAGSFTADGTGVVSNGELDSNHQGSNPAGATIVSNGFLGTYTLGADNRGLLTLTTLNANGTVGRTSTYAISVKAPVAPATTTAQGSLIEFDSNQLAGTKGSGTLLQQTAASFTTGLTGSYAFGVGGDTPCLPTCTVGIVAGPAAAVGQFSVAAGALTGTSDANIASVKYVSEQVAGSYSAADSNGRVQLTMTTAGTPATLYPADYALYMVDASHAFLLSTDKHSAAILLAGSAQSQTVASFNAANLAGPFIGYENAASNPGLAGVTLANVLNLSTATIFRQTADGVGNCTTTNLDTGGTTQLVNQLTSLGSGAPILNALLGTYQSLGTAACPVQTNGRAILNYPAPNTALSTTLTLLGLPVVPPPARVAYLAAGNRGYFLETGYAGLGQIEPQVNNPAGAPFSATLFNGTYVYGESPASSVATINASGFITAYGNGTATSTEDLNTGVGTLNVLTLGVTHNDTYTAPDPTSGRFLFNDTTVVDTSTVYVISPGRFVLLDTNPLTTSPSVTVLY